MGRIRTITILYTILISFLERSSYFQLILSYVNCVSSCYLELCVIYFSVYATCKVETNISNHSGHYYCMWSLLQSGK